MEEKRLNQMVRKNGMNQVKEKKMVYQWPEPYPPVQVKEKNRAYGRVMLDNLGGRNSEMSTVSVYFYDNLICQEYPEIATAFHHISIVEMHHLNIFGKLAYQLGEDPRLWSWDRGHKVYWSPGYHLYPLKMQEILKYAIQGEKDAVDKYTKQACVIKDEDIVANLNRIIQDERVHIALLNNLYETYCL